jgi:drug/metabolite transporter (DMT)-like permease
VTRRGLLLFAAMCVIWGIPYLFIRIAVGELTPATLVFLRTGVAAVVLLPIAARRGALRPALVRWRPLLVFAVIEIAIPCFAPLLARRSLRGERAPSHLNR